MKKPAPLSRTPEDLLELAAYGQAVREYRLKRGLTIAALARSANVSVSQLRRFEAGRASHPFLHPLLLIAHALGNRAFTLLCARVDELLREAKRKGKQRANVGMATARPSPS